MYTFKMLPLQYQVPFIQCLSSKSKVKLYRDFFSIFSTAGSELPLNATRWHHLLARGSFVLKCSQGLGRFLGNVNEGDPPPRRPPVHVQILGEVLGTHTRYPTLRLLAGRCFPTLLVPPPLVRG